MNTLVVHHTYENGMTFDVSMHRNHGIGIAVTPGLDAFASSLFFSRDVSRVNVRTSASLQQLTAIRSTIRFYLDQLPVRRLNLAEGHLSFAVFINPDRSVQGTILDATNQWRGIHSDAGRVRVNSFHTVTFEHDGISQCRLKIDGDDPIVAISIPGPVKSVGPLGLSVGAWPDADSQYNFHGYIDDFQLFKYDAVSDLHALLDPNCFDRVVVSQIQEKLKGAGWDSNRLLQYFYQMLTMQIKLTQALRGSESHSMMIEQDLTRDLLSAFLRRDTAALKAIEREFVTLGNGAAKSEVERLSKDYLSLFYSLPLEQSDYQRLAKALCLDFALLPHLGSSTADKC